MKGILLAGLTVMLIALGYLAFDDFTRAGLLASQGHAEEGSKFGVEIGMELDDAGHGLRERGLRPVALTAPASCHGRIYAAEHELELWYDDTWRRGTICLASVNGRVESISWLYNWIAP